MKKMMIVFDQSDVKKIQTRLIADVVECFRALDIRLSEWCCSVLMVWVQIPSREEQNLTAQRSNSNFQTYIYIYIYKGNIS